MRRIMIIALCTGACAVGPSLAAAAGPSNSPAAVIADCQHNNKLTGSYTSQALRRALATLPVDVSEYTDCHDVIQSQVFAQAHGGSNGGGTGGGSGSSFLPTPVIVIIVVLALAGITFTAFEVRRRRGLQ